jgi:DNA repair protein RecN (Recombination protein N)
VLIQLTVKNFVLIDELTIEFEDGLSVFTGETGAGKSLMVDAISLLSGQRASTSIIANSKQEAVVEGVFQLKKDSLAATIAKGYDFDVKDVMVFTRSISRDNKNTCKINHRMVPLSTFKEILEAEIDIHSQHDTQYLLQEKNHIRLLDNFLQNQTLANEVSKAYSHYQEANNYYQQILNEQLDEADRDFLEYQRNEIDSFDPKQQEYDELLDRQKQMIAFEKISTISNQSLQALTQEEGVLENLYVVIKLLADLHEVPLAKQLSESLYDGYAIIEDVKEQLSEYLLHLSFDDDEYGLILDRLAGYDQLRRRHGATIDLIVEKKENIDKKLYQLDHHEQVVLEAKETMDLAYKIFEKVSLKLSNERAKAAKLLKTNIQKHLKDLQLPHAEFDVSFERTAPSKRGLDKIVFLLKTNPGSSLAPLAKVASGGELSRLMLGLKAIFTPLQGCGTIIFDEIDVGVSGAVAHKVGLKMHELSQQVQTFTITHLPVVSCFGNTHFDVRKHSNQNTTTVTIVALNDEQRVEQLALMASGNNNQPALNAAHALLEQIQEEIARG